MTATDARRRSPSFNARYQSARRQSFPSCRDRECFSQRDAREKVRAAMRAHCSIYLARAFNQMYGDLMNKSTENPFRHLSLTRLQPRLDVKQIANMGVAEALSNAKDLAKSAMSIFIGVFPRVSPYFFWDSGDYLPWYGQFEGKPNAQTHAICEISSRLLGGKTISERGPILFEAFPFEMQPNEHIIQYLAVEMLLAIEGLLDSISSGDLVTALAWQHAAFAHLSEATVTAIELLERSPHSYTLH
jgi:hypothetical protein